MKKVSINSSMNGPRVKALAASVGGTITRTAGGVPTATIFVLTLTDRELLSDAISQLEMFNQEPVVVNVLDKLRKVLAT